MLRHYDGGASTSEGHVRSPHHYRLCRATDGSTASNPQRVQKLSHGALQGATRTRVRSRLATGIAWRGSPHKLRPSILLTHPLLRRVWSQDLKLRDESDLRAAMRDPSLVFEATAVRSLYPNPDLTCVSRSRALWSWMMHAAWDDSVHVHLLARRVASTAGCG